MCAASVSFEGASSLLRVTPGEIGDVSGFALLREKRVKMVSM